MALYASNEPLGVCFIVLGSLILLTAMVMLWTNEKRAVKYSMIVEQAQQACTVVDPNRPVQNNLFKLVHLSGVATNREDLVDLDFGVVAQDSYRLRRRVQMFRWVETFNEGV